MKRKNRNTGTSQRRTKMVAGKLICGNDVLLALARGRAVNGPNGFVYRIIRGKLSLCSEIGNVVCEKPVNWFIDGQTFEVVK